MTLGRPIVLSAVAAATIAATLLWPAAATAQCAMCRTALASPEGQHLAAALRSGILLLLAAPFATFGAIAALAVRMHRRRAAHPRR
jgi:hypothetical protein